MPDDAPVINAVFLITNTPHRMNFSIQFVKAKKRQRLTLAYTPNYPFYYAENILIQPKIEKDYSCLSCNIHDIVGVEYVITLQVLH
jgi:hypothetical protein